MNNMDYILMNKRTNVLQNVEILSKQELNNAMMEMKYNMMAVFNVYFLAINIALSVNKEVVNNAKLDTRKLINNAF